MTRAIDLLVLAVGEEGIPADHIAAKVALPLGLLVFVGSVYLLVWAVYGAKKGALVLGTGFFGFAMMMGVFWWFGAPGTPTATGLQNFPYQSPERYTAKWYAAEPGSERAEYFESTNSLESFQTAAAAVGHADAEGEELEELESDPKFRVLTGDLTAAGDIMLEQYLPTDANGATIIGARRRAALIEEAGPARPGEQPADPFFSARVATEGDDPEGEALLFVTEEKGLRLAGAVLQVVATFESVDAEGKPVTREVIVEEKNYYAFKDPGALWVPSAGWTVISALLFGGCLFGLDRIEQRAKARVPEREPVAAHV